MMNKKCNKYQELFINAKDSEILDHIKSCPECLKEHIRMKRTENLIRQAAPYFKKKEKQYIISKIVAGICLIMLCINSFPQNNEDFSLYLYETYSNNSSKIQANLPLDNYGLLDLS